MFKSYFLSPIISIILIGTIITAVDVIYYIRYTEKIMGFFSVSNYIDALFRPSIIIGATFSGVISSNILRTIRYFFNLAEDTQGSLSYIDKQTLLFASVIAPAVIAGTYENAIKIPNNFYLFLVCYQNGFFWDSVGSIPSTLSSKKQNS